MKKTCIILGNCQTRPLAFYLNYYIEGIEFLPFEVFALTDIQRQQLNKLLEDENQIILTQNIGGEKFDKLTTKNIRQKYKNVYTITNFHFKGLFPDIIYLGDSNNRIKSAASDYNSQIVFENFIRQKTVEECTQSFHYKTYEDLGFFSAYEASASELLKREEFVDIKYAEEFLYSLQERQTIFSINHPCDATFDNYARKIAKSLDWRLSSKNFPETLYPNILSGITCALYDEIAEFHNIRYAYNNFYIIQRNFYSLEDFVRESYRAYKNQLSNILKNHLSYLKNIDENRYNIAKLVISHYQAVMKRQPDYQGFVNMCNFLEKQGVNVASITQLFESAIGSPEFKQKFGVL